MAGNPGITEDDKQALRDQLGLSDPLPVLQMGRYAAGLAEGDFGESLRFPKITFGETSGVAADLETGKGSLSPS